MSATLLTATSFRSHWILLHGAIARGDVLKLFHQPLPYLQIAQQSWACLILIALQCLVVLLNHQPIAADPLPRARQPYAENTDSIAPRSEAPRGTRIDPEQYDPVLLESIPKTPAIRPSTALPSDAPIELGEEWVEWRRKLPRGTAGTYARETIDCGGWWYLPNRVLDIFDMFRVDAGVGLSKGAVLRLTRWGQVGYREAEPFSFRVGLFGRDWPVLIEQSVEQGVGPWFNQSRERDVADFEVGLALDLFIVGGYAGVNLGGVADFVLGFFCIDPSDDDRYQ